MQKNYRATFILDTRDYEEPVDTIVQKIKAVIAGLGGTVEALENTGSRDFARVTDRKFPAGQYVLATFSGAATIPAQLKERFALDRTVNRIMVENL